MQDPVIFAFTVLFAYLLNRWAEHRISNRNYSVLKTAGGEELSTGLVSRYYLVCLLIFPAAILEQFVVRQPIFREMLLIGLFLIIFGHLIRFWAISSLGTHWSMHCIGLPGLRPLNAGPYRYMNNPEYFSRVMDGVGIAVMTGARFSGFVFIVVSLLMIRKLNSIEQRQLSELSCLLPSRYRQPA